MRLRYPRMWSEAFDRDSGSSGRWSFSRSSWLAARRAAEGRFNPADHMFGSEKRRKRTSDFYVHD